MILPQVDPITPVEVQWGDKILTFRKAKLRDLQYGDDLAVKYNQFEASLRLLARLLVYEATEEEKYNFLSEMDVIDGTDGMTKVIEKTSIAVGMKKEVDPKAPIVKQAKVS